MAMKGAVVIGVLAVALSVYAKMQYLAVFCGLTAVVFCVIAFSAVFLGKEEQLKIVRFTETEMVCGPKVFLLIPFTYRSARVQQAESLGPMEYLKVKDSTTGEERVERGPKLLFPGPYDVISARGVGLTLTRTEYVIVEDKLSGQSSTVKGPCIWNPTPHVTASSKQTAIPLQEDEFIRVLDTASGNKQVIRGKNLVFLEPTWKVESGVSKAWTLQANEYVRLLDKISGRVTVHRGESTVFPGSHEELLDGSKMQAIDLKVNEYVKLLDNTDGNIRVVTGASQVFLGPHDAVLDGGKKNAVEVDDQHAVLVRDLSTGQLRLETRNQLFFPGANESIESVRSLHMLADHEAMIIKDKDGVLQYHYGDSNKMGGGGRAFFLQPHSEVVTLHWSGGARRAKRDLKISCFDLRPQFMWNELDCRTGDNVELILETTLFWEVTDLPLLVRTTGNLTGDIYNQIRSQFIKHVAQKTLKQFMEELHEISGAIFAEDQDFYTKRGVSIHSLEVTKYTCAEKRTSEVLQQIIEETTNRLNRLSKQESENEVNLFRMQGQIEQEKLNGDLLAIQHEHSKNEAQVSGSAEAERVAAFVNGLTSHVPKLEDRIHMWEVLRKTDALSVIASGGANLYYTPNDIDLSIKTEPVRES